MSFIPYIANINNCQYDAYIYMDGQWIEVEPYINDNSENAYSDISITDTATI